jgi:hypothetical protein
MSNAIAIAPGIAVLAAFTAGTVVCVSAAESARPSAAHPPPVIQAACRAPLAASAAAAQHSGTAAAVVRHAAVMHWRAAAEARYGFDFSLWWQAQGRSVTCESATGQLVCTASAAPCTIKVRGSDGVSKAF